MLGHVLEDGFVFLGDCFGSERVDFLEIVGIVLLVVLDCPEFLLF